MHLFIDFVLLFAIFILGVSVIKTLVSAPLTRLKFPVAQFLVMSVFVVLLAVYGF